ncbi:hypothetical protein QL093DRAFT_2368996 [Fusarium oxysporum]|jgi:hypothetical protein|nr:hypothetical protein QL093DRAFT_2368996 [Fusarium oxysporum]
MPYTRRRAYVVYPGYRPAEAYEPNELQIFIAIISLEIPITTSERSHHEETIRKHSD